MKESNFLYHCRGAHFSLYRLFFNLQTMFSFFNLEAFWLLHKDLFIKITMQKCSLYVELLQLKIHTCCNPSITWIEHIFTTCENISSKSILCFWLNPFTTNRVLYFSSFSSFFFMNTHLFLSAFLPFGSSINSYVLFFRKEFISSCMTLSNSLCLCETALLGSSQAHPINN